MGTLVSYAALAFVHISDDLPNGPHLEVNDAIELGADDTQVASSCSETTLSASERHFAHIARQSACRRVVPSTSNAMLPFGYRPTPSSSRATSLWLYVWTGRSGDEFTVIFRSVSQVTRSKRISKVT
jgi:hypothetical protein